MVLMDFFLPSAAPPRRARLRALPRRAAATHRARRRHRRRAAATRPPLHQASRLHLARLRLDRLRAATLVRRHHHRLAEVRQALHLLAAPRHIPPHLRIHHHHLPPPPLHPHTRPPLLLPHHRAAVQAHRQVAHPLSRAPRLPLTHHPHHLRVLHRAVRRLAAGLSLIPGKP